MKKLVVVFSVIATILTCFASMPSISTAFQAPPGELYSVTLTSTVEGIQSALNGEMGTGVFAKGDGMVFMWRMLNGWAFVGLNTDVKNMTKAMLEIRANYGNLSDYPGIVQALTKAGWVSISYKIVEGSIKNPVLMATINKILGYSCDRFTTFVLLPLTTNPDQIGAIRYEKIDPALSQQ